MEEVRTRSLKGAFAKAVALTMVAVALCSGLAIFGCYQLQKHILPDSNEVWLTQQITAADGSVEEVTSLLMVDGPSESFSRLVADGQEGETLAENATYSVKRLESGFSQLSDRAQLAYRGSQAAMVLLPLLFAAIGIGVCAWWFYRKKLEPPIRVLSDAAAHVERQDLDFQISCASNDELGQLCKAFEGMRRALADNNRQLWGMLEDRRALQASVAHDLRNPIAIIAGYVEHLRASSEDGSLTDGELRRALANLDAAAGRMERYTRAMQKMGAFEEVEVKAAEVNIAEYLDSMADSLGVLGHERGIGVSCSGQVPGSAVIFDGELFYRVLDNLVANALRFARSEVAVVFALQGGTLSATVTDDGPGFSEAVLQRKGALFFTEDTTGEHLGLGLAMGRILCQKHGGALELSNGEEGACAKASITVREAPAALLG